MLSLTSIAQNPPANIDNLDFSKGDFTGWTGRQTVYKPDHPDANNCVNKSSNPNYKAVTCLDGSGYSCNGCFSHPLYRKPVPPTSANVGPIPFYDKQIIEDGRLTIMSKPGEFDRFTCGNVPTIPLGEKYAARIGNGGINPNNTTFYPQGCTNPVPGLLGSCNYQPGQAGWTDGVGFQVDYLSRTFKVDSYNTLLYYKFAVVFQEPVDPVLKAAGKYDGSHTKNISPRFVATVRDSANIIEVFDVTSADTIPGFSECQPTDYLNLGGKVYGRDLRIVYLPWTTIGVDLRKYIGRNINIEFNTWDCGWGGHFGYAYVTAKSDTFAIKSKLVNGKMIVSAPDGFTYKWLPNNQTTKDIELPNYQLGDSVSVELVNASGSKSVLGSKIYPSINTSINNASFKNANNTLQIYPNPTNSELQILGTQKLKSYTVLNHLGAEVLSGNLEQHSSIFVNTLANGLYFIKVKDIAGHELQAKFVKE